MNASNLSLDHPKLASTLRALAIVFALGSASALAVLCWLLPLPPGSVAGTRHIPQSLLFVGRFHPVLLHLPIGLLVFAGGLRVLAWHRLGSHLHPALTICLWAGAASAVLAAAAGWLLAQEGGYDGPSFELHWRLGLSTVALWLVLLVLHHHHFRGAAFAQGAAWVATLGSLGLGAHQGGALTHGEDFLAEYAPAFLKPMLGGRYGAPIQRANAANDPAFAAIAELFGKYCTECHGASKAKGDQRLHTPEDIAKGGKSGASVVPGDPEKSLVLARLLLPAGDKKHMPPEGKPQPTAMEIGTVREWISDGAPGLPRQPARNLQEPDADVFPVTVQSRPLPQRSDTQNPPPMKTTPSLVAAALVTGSTAFAEAPGDPKSLAADALKIFQTRCVECHGSKAEDPDEFAFIDDLARLRASEYVNLTNPQVSKLYTMVQQGEMPRRTKADKEAGKKRADPLTPDQVAMILSWINAGAPDGTTPGAPVAENTPAPILPTPAPTSTVAAPGRKLITPAEEFTAALADLQTVPREEQADTRYVSFASVHNNTRIADPQQLENLRRGVRKLLNSLSTGPRAINLSEVGPNNVLFRVRLRDLGWDAALWDKVASHFPQAIETSVSSALGAACHTTIPILRAEWLAANATKPPLYHDILRIPKDKLDLEREFGVDLNANLQAGEAVRSGLVRSGISLANRLVERHEMRSRNGYYWISYDFKSSSGRGNLLEFPLGPEQAHLAGGQRAFRHAGGEIVFTLPNGFHGYMLADARGNRLDGAAPTDIVGDRTNVTGRVEISNGLSCIVCHDKGIKEIGSPDAIRPLATKFTASEQRLIERLHPSQDKFDAILKDDTTRFLAALKAANAEPIANQPEPVGALAALFDGAVSLEIAAAEIGLSPEDLKRRLEDQAQLFALRVSLKDNGTLQREHFLDALPELVERLDLGTVRTVQPIASVPLPGRSPQPKPIAIELKTDKTAYREGEDLVVFVQAAERGHLRLLYQNAKGEIYTLFPNQFITDDRIEGGRLIKVMPALNPTKPGDEAAIVIAGPNFGTEFLAAIVTDQPFTDEAALREELKKATFAKSVARDIERALTKDARVISRPTREGDRGGARAGFARVALTTQTK